MFLNENHKGEETRKKDENKEKIEKPKNFCFVKKNSKMETRKNIF